MEKPNPIKLPEEIEKEMAEKKQCELKEKIEKYRADGTLFINLMDFLAEFEKRVNTFNYYLQSYVPYPTISQTVKNIIRDKLRTVNEFYTSFTGSNPHPIIAEFDEKNDRNSAALRIVYARISISLEQLNKHIQSISEKKVIFYKSEPKHFTFEWT